MPKHVAAALIFAAIAVLLAIASQLLVLCQVSAWTKQIDEVRQQVVDAAPEIQRRGYLLQSRCQAQAMEQVAGLRGGGQYRMNQAQMMKCLAQARQSDPQAMEALDVLNAAILQQTSQVRLPKFVRWVGGGE